MAGILFLGEANSAGESREAAAASVSIRRVRCDHSFIIYGVLVGAVTVRLTVGPAVVELVLLETTPAESTPTIVNVYVFAGVTPFGVVVEVVLLPQPGAIRNVPHSTTNASRPHAFRERFPANTLPMPTSPRIGSESHRPKALRELFAPVVIGPNVLIVRVEVCGCPLMGRLVDCEGYENEQTGAIVTSGEMEAQYSVTPADGPPVGLMYPLIGFTVTTPWAPLPAGTLVGATLLDTVMVNCGVTANTVNGRGGVVKVVDGPVPVIEMLYATVLVSILVVTVAVAVAGGFTAAGLTVQTGGSTMELSDGLTLQLRFTVPLNPLTDPMTMLDDDVPVGATATGLNVAACRVNSVVP